jgi:hypothetical protein
MKKLGLKEISPLCLPFGRGEFKSSIVSIISAIIFLLASMMLAGCTTLTPLHDAAFEGDIRTAKELLDKGANIDAGTSSDPGFTPLVYAAYGNAPLEFVRLLVERGANVNAASIIDGFTPVAWAATHRRRDIVTYLVDKGADIDKAIGVLDRHRDQQAAMEFLYGLKKEMADSTQQKGVQTTALDKEPPTIKSDVDELPLVNVKPNKTSYAIVIGIENYRQKLPKADFATHDARTMTEYLTKALGYREENVITLLNDHATYVDLVKYLEKWLPNNVENGGSVFVYYSGHGAPNAKTGDAYLVPYDGDPTFIAETGYSLARLYESLGKLKAKEIVIVLDSCFSGGGGRSVLAKGAKPLVITMNTPNIKKNLAVMTASSGDQISSAYEEQGHGLFTYYMLKGIKNENVTRPDGSIKLDDLFNYVKPQVERIARKQFNNEQTPQLIEARKPN